MLAYIEDQVVWAPEPLKALGTWSHSIMTPEPWEVEDRLRRLGYSIMVLEHGELKYRIDELFRGCPRVKRAGRCFRGSLPEDITYKDGYFYTQVPAGLRWLKKHCLLLEAFYEGNEFYVPGENPHSYLCEDIRGEIKRLKALGFRVKPSKLISEVEYRSICLKIMKQITQEIFEDLDFIPVDVELDIIEEQVFLSSRTADGQYWLNTILE